MIAAITAGHRVSRDGSYRPEIDGLRAIAVLGVILCHLKFPAVSGGFVGVDVFFVISGYLISRNILTELQQNRFSLLGFYDRRIRRIFPALFVSIAASFIVGLILFSPRQLQILAGDVVSSLFSMVNIRFWRGSYDYFASSADERSLLHLWSLSVEEQFYLFWPFLLLILMRLKRQGWLIAAVISLALGSFVASLLWMLRDPTAVFYLTPFRIFEFAFGTFIALADRRKPPSSVASVVALAVGLTMILLPMAVYTAATFSPASIAIPAAGTALAIYGGRASLLSNALGNAVAAGIGRISYSLYLCHWPVIVWCSHVMGEAADALWVKLILLVLIFCLAVLMFRFVEQPFRLREPTTKKGFGRLMAACAGLVALVAIPAHAAFKQQGWFWRYNQADQSLMRKQAFAIYPCDVGASCVFGNVSGPIGVQIIGDSFAQQYVSALQPLLIELGLRGESYAMGGCLMLEGLQLMEWLGPKCLAERDAALNRIRQTNAPVMIAQSWAGYRSGLADQNGALEIRTDEQQRKIIGDALSRTLESINTPGRHVLLIGSHVRIQCDRYETEVQRFTFAKKLTCAPPSIDEMKLLTGPWNRLLQSIAFARPDLVRSLMPEDFICTDVCHVVKDGVWLYRDGVHLTVAGAELLGSRARAPLMLFLKGGEPKT